MDVLIFYGRLDGRCFYSMFKTKRYELVYLVIFVVLKASVLLIDMFN